MKIIENKSFDKERALYGSQGLILRNCRFDGSADGESALKESRDITVDNCLFNLRYPFWHDEDIKITNSEMTSLCRAAIWYSGHIIIDNSKLQGIKALRECHDVEIKNSGIISPEFGWSVNNCKMENTHAEGEYFMLRSESLDFSGVQLKGKYSFQYVKNSVIKNCNFDTKDSFWHSENVTIYDSEIKSEYFAWYADHLTLINCKIIGTQPLCYCTNLKMINCEMEGADYAFEKSDVDAEINSHMISIKNPKSGVICVKNVDNIIMDDPDAKGKILTL